ncbi:hypothetical protein [Streptomyces sp. NPDC058751]|uniref:hypothetical protein n=1 Tax=Streptomyces sp. NPDC058751 TaxID=3346623 RepID=UPI0036AC3FD4
MTEKLPDKQALFTVIQALGGDWDTKRAVLGLSVAGHEKADDEATAKAARGALRALTDDGLIVRPDPDRAVYRLA